MTPNLSDRRQLIRLSMHITLRTEVERSISNKVQASALRAAVAIAERELAVAVVRQSEGSRPRLLRCARPMPLQNLPPIGSRVQRDFVPEEQRAVLGGVINTNSLRCESWRR